MFEAQDSHFEKRVRDSFARQEAMKTINASLEKVAAGEVTITMPYQRNLTQQHGFIHAGIVATILDSACGYAAFSLMPANAAVLTVEYKINLLAAAIGKKLSAYGHVIRSGRTITVCNGEVFAYDDKQDKKIVATMQSTIMAVFDREGVES